MLSAQPSPGITRYLTPAEEVVHVSRRHPIVLARAFGLWVASVLAGTAVGLLVSPRTSTSLVDQMAGGLVLAATALLAWRTWRWWLARYVITDRRVLHVEGIVSRNVSAIQLSKVTDTTFRRSVWGRILGYGDLLLDVPGEHGGLRVLTTLPRPEALYRTIVSVVVGERGAPLALPGSRRAERADEEETGPLPWPGP
ncbi:MAG: PH domain-containing protein [Actinomycetota bacterium]